MRYPEFPVGAFLAAILVLIPLPAHWRSRNVATMSIIAWLFVMDIVYGVNTIVWDGNVFKRLLVWCDISEYTFHVISSFFADRDSSHEAHHRRCRGAARGDDVCLS